MAGFAEQLWESIFTPGPTPSLLIATNVTFASLQLVLLVLLIATYSVHFVILSFLCGGLWWSINWFAAELTASQAREERDKARAEQRRARHTTDDSDTEVETTVAKGPPRPGSKGVEAVEQTGELRHRAEVPSDAVSSVSTEDEWEKVSESEKDR